VARADGRFRYNLGLFGRAKKCWKSADEVLAATYCLVSEPSPGYDNECSLLANDKDQAADDLSLVKKLVQANPVLEDWLVVRRDTIERKDGRGYLEILPARDVAGAHGKSRRFIGWDEIHEYRDWDIFESLQPDPHRLDCQQWVTSYASLFHRPGVPLFDLLAMGKTGADSRMLFSWYAADFTTDPDFTDKSPEERANPSMASWADPNYLTFRRQFEVRGVAYQVCEQTKSQLYEAFEPLLNAKSVVLPDVPVLEQQLLGLRWRGGKIDHEHGEHDDYANCAVGVVAALQPKPARGPSVAVIMPDDAGEGDWRSSYFR
jgi:hypothetical protein